MANKSKVVMVKRCPYTKEVITEEEYIDDPDGVCPRCGKQSWVSYRTEGDVQLQHGKIHYEKVLGTWEEPSWLGALIFGKDKLFVPSKTEKGN